MKAMRKDTARTRKKIISVAERMYGEAGVEGVSLNELTRESGQRNKSALTYHFGSKKGLLLAIIDKHMLGDEGQSGLIQQRDALLRAMEEKGHTDLESVIRAVLTPLVAKLDDEDGGVSFIRIVAQLVGNRLMCDVFDERPAYFGKSDHYPGLLEALAPCSDEALRKARMAQGLGLMLNSLIYIADVMAENHQGSAGSRSKLLLANLMDTLMAIATLEPSGATRKCFLSS